MDPSHLPLIELDPKDGYNVYHFYIRNKDMTKYIFVDLDETLIHTFNSWEDRTGDKVQQFTLSDGDEYTTCLRNRRFGVPRQAPRNWACFYAHCCHK